MPDPTTDLGARLQALEFFVTELGVKYAERFGEASIEQMRVDALRVFMALGPHAESAAEATEQLLHQVLLAHRERRGAS